MGPGDEAAQREWAAPEAPAESGFAATKHPSPRCTNNLMRFLKLPEVNGSDPYQCRQTDVVLIHIPKTGGTSIEKAGLKSRDRLLWGLQYDNPRFRRRRRDLPTLNSSIPICKGNFGKRCCSWWHVPPRYLLDWRPYFGAPTRFCVVRNPYARVLSEYAFRHGKEIRALSCAQLNHTEVNIWIRARMEQHLDGDRTL